MFLAEIVPGWLAESAGLIAYSLDMLASWIFSTNNVIADLGVIISGGLAWYFGSRYPDLIVDAIISTVIVRGGFKILNEIAHSNEAHGDV